MEEKDIHATYAGNEVSVWTKFHKLEKETQYLASLRKFAFDKNKTTGEIKIKTGSWLQSREFCETVNRWKEWG